MFRLGTVCAVATSMFVLVGSWTAHASHAALEAADTTQFDADNPRSSDAVITTTIQGRYFGSRDVKGRDIDVDTDNGVVTLSGTVQTERIHQEAVRIARGVNGVRRVNDRLRVGTVRDADADRSPTWITTKVQAQYYMHPTLKPWRIDVTTSDAGVVTLAGRVDNQADRNEAIRIAKNTEGVVQVRDRMTPDAASDSRGVPFRRPGDAVTDGWITAKIQSKYFVDADVKGRNIDVDTNRGIVTLKGEVASNLERDHALSLARNTDGVRNVRDQLRVRPRAVATTGRDEGRARGTSQRVDDQWITMKIQSKYFLDSNVHGSLIDVSSKNGVVTLNGSVRGEGERREAMRLARETDGVNRVVNRLKVE